MSGSEGATKPRSSQGSGWGSTGPPRWVPPPGGAEGRHSYWKREQGRGAGLFLWLWARPLPGSQRRSRAQGPASFLLSDPSPDCRSQRPDWCRGASPGHLGEGLLGYILSRGRQHKALSSPRGGHHLDRLEQQRQETRGPHLCLGFGNFSHGITGGLLQPATWRMLRT